MNLYVKMFLVTAVPFALVTAVALAFVFDLREAALSGLLVGLLFGLLMTVILGTLHWWFTRKSAKGRPTGPNQTITLKLDPPTAKVFDKCAQALEQFGAEIEALERNKKFIEATTEFTWKSWGEVIQIHISDQEKDGVRVQISSSPKVKTTLVDYGKGRQNVEEIAALVTGAGESLDQR